MFSRKLLISCWVAATLGGCRLFDPKPPEAPPSKPALPSAPAPLPPEETPAPEPAPSASSAPAPAKPVEPGVAPTGAPTRGKLPKAVIDEKLASAGPAIRACYERGLKEKPALHGSVNVDFVVAPDGSVAHTSAQESDDALDDPATVDCILAEIAKLQFPEPRGGRVFINYPLRFEAPQPAP